MQDPRQPMEIGICPLQRGITELQQLLMSRMNLMRPQEPKFRALIPEGYIREVCLLDLLIASLSILRTKDLV
ncbi:hypothetical protein TNCV_2794131 [Trichonephila clavipes]|nr:hypothetical protein TNCV_2794131 [Trichonephila clavipes]